jgi:ribonuclease P protein component
MLPRPLRLRKSHNFRQVYRQGRSWAHPAAVLYAQRQAGPGKRFGVSASRKLGGAVQRNRIRRRLMAICQQLEPRVPPGMDLVLVARPEALQMTPPELQAAVETLLRRAGAWTEATPS